MNKITICMGSSCFSRGNGDNAQLVQEYIEKHGLEGNVELQGCLCRGQCKDGPNIEVNGKLYGDVSVDNITSILDEALGGAK